MVNNGSVMKNKRTVQLLRSLLGGRHSAWTKLGEYTYQSALVDDKLSKQLTDIARDEMHHAQLISRLIASLGAKPYIENGKGIPWSARFLNYTSDPLIFLKNNIRNSEIAIENYQRAINLILNEEINQTLTNILDEEKAHLEQFTKMLRNLENSGSQ